MTLTMTTAKQPFHKTLQLVNTHCQTNQNKSAVQNIETVMISLNEPKLSYCDLDLEERTPFFAHDTLAYSDAGFGYKRFSDS